MTGRKFIGGAAMMMMEYNGKEVCWSSGDDDLRRAAIMIIMMEYNGKQICWR